MRFEPAARYLPARWLKVVLKAPELIIFPGARQPQPSPGPPWLADSDDGADRAISFPATSVALHFLISGIASKCFQ